jgi:hypothetical protein
MLQTVEAESEIICLASCFWTLWRFLRKSYYY